MAKASEPVPAPEQEAAPAVAADDWSPQAANEDGIYMTGDYPTNHRLRAEALSKARRKSDPDGIIDEDLIASTSDRLKAEREDGG